MTTNITRCEGCPKWVRSLKDTMFCDDCLRLHQILESLWKSEQQGKSVTADDRP